MHLFEDPAIWVSVSVIIFLLLIAKPVSKFAATALDKRAIRIKEELDEAMRLKEEAQSVLALYQRKQKKIEDEAGEILKKAKQEANRIIKNTKANIERDIAQRTELATQKIAQAEASVIKEIQDNAIDITISAARTLIVDHLSTELGEDIVLEAVNDIGRKFH